MQHLIMVVFGWDENALRMAHGEAIRRRLGPSKTCGSKMNSYRSFLIPTSGETEPGGRLKALDEYMTWLDTNLVHNPDAPPDTRRSKVGWFEVVYDWEMPWRSALRTHAPPRVPLPPPEPDPEPDEVTGLVDEDNIEPDPIEPDDEIALVEPDYSQKTWRDKVKGIRDAIREVSFNTVQWREEVTSLREAIRDVRQHVPGNLERFLDLVNHLYAHHDARFQGVEGDVNSLCEQVQTHHRDITSVDSDAQEALVILERIHPRLDQLEKQVDKLQKLKTTFETHVKLEKAKKPGSNEELDLLRELAATVRHYDEQDDAGLLNTVLRLALEHERFLP